MKPLLSGLATRQRIKHILPYLNGNILDIGCGWTDLPDLLSPEQAYTGVDLKENALKNNQSRYPQHTFIRQNIDTEALAFDGQIFDTVVLTAVLEHIHSPDKVMREIRTLLAPGGHLLLTTPSPWGDWFHKFGSQIRLFYSEEHVGHVKIFNRQELHKIMTDTGFQVTNFRFFLIWLNQLIVGTPTE